MLTRRFGRTGHMSTVAIFGSYALSAATEEQADAAMEQVVAAGVNHIDVAPSYGLAEERLGPWLARERSRFFVGCKTMERTREDAERELHASLARLRTETFDLYQLHAVRTMEELDEVTARGGALEAAVAARDEGLARFIGITSHGWRAPAVLAEALRRFDFDSVLFPVNFVMFGNPEYRAGAEALLADCRARDVGVMAIKANAQRMWGQRAPRYNTWYEPFEDFGEIRRATNFALSQEGVTGLCSTGDPVILPQFLAACSQFEPMGAAEQEALVARAGEYQSVFA